MTGGGSYSSGDTAVVTATPNSGYTFTGWSGACSGIGSCSVTMNSNKSATASFSLPLDDHGDSESTATLVSVPSTIYGNLSSSDKDYLAFSVDGEGEYYSITSKFTGYYDGPNLELYTEPSGVSPVDMDWSLGWWIEYAPTSPGTLYLRISSLYTGDYEIVLERIAATVVPKQQYTLAVNSNPSHGGAVSGGGTYSSGDVATVTATPQQGYSFDGWSGSCSGTGSCSVTMNSDKSVTAAFSQKQHSLTTETTTSGSYGGGSVRGAGIYS